MTREAGSDGPVEVRAGYVALAHGHVHYRVAGAGPPVVLLHDSPRSSLLHLRLMRRLGRRFTVYAIDTPGYGRSEPLPSAPRPEITDFAGALAATLHGLGLVRPVVYAYHTSSKIALECAARFPGRIGYLILDGLALPEAPASEEFIERYMSPFVPDAAGAYIALAWTKIRDLHRFFPWFERRVAHRTPIDEPEPRALHDYALDYFMAGENYASAYSAAMRYTARPVLARLETPATVMARADDVLFGFLEAAEACCSATTCVERLPAGRARWLRRLSAILSRAAVRAGFAPELQAATAPEGPRYVPVPGGQAHVVVRGRHADRDVLFLHAPPGGARGAGSLLTAMGASCTVHAPDLPGCGGTDPLSRPDPFSAYLDWLEMLIDRLGLGSFGIAAQGLAAPLALGLGARRGGQVTRILVDGLAYVGPSYRAELARRYAPPVRVSRDGTHFSAMFHRLRDEQIQWPWYDRRASAARSSEPELAPQRLHARLLDALAWPKHYGDVCRAALSIDAGQWARALGAPLTVLDVPGDPAYTGTRELAACAANGVVVAAGGEPGAREQAVCRWAAAAG